MVKLLLPTGTDRFSANIRDMTGYSPLPVFKLCWKYLTPAVCTVSDPLPCWRAVTLFAACSLWNSTHINTCLWWRRNFHSCLSNSGDMCGLSTCLHTYVTPISDCLHFRFVVVTLSGEKGVSLPSIVSFLHPFWIFTQFFYRSPDEQPAMIVTVVTSLKSVLSWSLH